MALIAAGIAIPFLPGLALVIHAHSPSVTVAFADAVTDACTESVTDGDGVSDTCCHPR